jgi:hypothetical protein
MRTIMRSQTHHWMVAAAATGEKDRANIGNPPPEWMILL